MATDALATVVEEIDKQEWPDTVAEPLQKGVQSAIEAAGPAGQPIADALNGVWLGHPLHPVLTDLPLGAWSAALCMDVSGSEKLEPGADAAVAIGLAGAVGAAVTGIMDWQHTDGRARKVGVLHAALNVSATVMYASSLLLRRRGARTAGKVTSYLGYAAVFASSWLGGHLVYGEQIGMDHAAGKELPQGWTPVLADADLAEGSMKRVDVKGTPILLARQRGVLYALVETCAHLGGPLSEGELKDGCVVCPWHGSCFSLDSGEVLNGPSTFPQPTLETRVVNGQIEVMAPPEHS